MVANEHSGGRSRQEYAVVRFRVDVDDHRSASVVTHDGDGGGAFARANVFNEVHIERKCHDAFSYGSAGDAECDVRQRLQRSSVREAVLISMFRVVDDKT